MSKDLEEQFIESWGAMGVLWGINRSMARIHALLLLSDQPLSLDDIAKRLQISRGNASMSLKELRNWRVIHRAQQPGDRRDFYEAESDAWRLFFRIATERKKREFDPALEAVHALLGSPEALPEGPSRERVAALADLLATFNNLASQFLASEQGSRALLQLFFKSQKAQT